MRLFWWHTLGIVCLWWSECLSVDCLCLVCGADKEGFGVNHPMQIEVG